jgi:hypothetical protein
MYFQLVIEDPVKLPFYTIIVCHLANTGKCYNLNLRNLNDQIMAEPLAGMLACMCNARLRLRLCNNTYNKTDCSFICYCPPVPGVPA